MSQSPLEKHPSVVDSVYLDAYILWSEDRDNHFLPPFPTVPQSEIPGFKLVFLKGNKSALRCDKWAGLSSPAGIPVRKEKKKNNKKKKKKKGYTDV